jgi:hypothetical protein
MLYLSTCVGFGYGLDAGAVSRKTAGRRPNPVRGDTPWSSSPPAGWGVLTPFPSATAFALALGARLTLRGLTWRRNPWTFGVRGSHPHGATHVSIRASDTSTGARAPASPAYGTLRYRGRHVAPARSFGARLEPRYIFGAGQLFDQ